MVVPERQRVSRLTPLAQVYERIAAMRPVEPREIALAQARGRVLASAAIAGRPLPPHLVALQDGFAVAADLLGDASPYAPVPLETAPVFVEIGDAMPSGTDAVLPPDAVVARNGVAEAMSAVAPGDGVLAAGGDSDGRTPLRRAGAGLRDLDIAVLLAAGVSHVRVREPRIAIVCAVALDDAQDFVGALIARAVEASGGAAVFHPGATGTDALDAALADGGVDAVLSIGGTGEGRRDASIRTLARIGRVDIHGMGLRPGATAALGMAGTRPVLLMPGRLDAALAVWLTVGGRLIASLSAATDKEPAWSAVLTRKIASAIGLAEIVPVGACEGGIEPLASGHFPLQAMTRAAGWVLVPPDSEGYAAGSVVNVMAFP